MLKKTHVAALACALFFSASLINTPSYGYCSGMTEVDNLFINAVGFSPDTGKFFMSTKLNNKDVNLIITADSNNYRNSLMQPLEILAYMNHNTVDVCYTTSPDGKTYYLMDLLVESSAPNKKSPAISLPHHSPTPILQKIAVSSLHH